MPHREKLQFFYICGEKPYTVFDTLEKVLFRWYKVQTCTDFKLYIIFILCYIIIVFNIYITTYTIIVQLNNSTTNNTIKTHSWC